MGILAVSIGFKSFAALSAAIILPIYFKVIPRRF